MENFNYELNTRKMKDVIDKSDLKNYVSEKIIAARGGKNFKKLIGRSHYDTGKIDFEVCYSTYQNIYGERHFYDTLDKAIEKFNSI